MNRRLLPIILGLVACADEPTSPSGLSDADGAPAQIVYVRDEYAGGSRVLDSLVVDSSSGTWRHTVCGPIPAVGMTCGPTTTRVDQGVITAAIRASLFERARRPDFRALRRDYPRTGVTPPDLAAYHLEIVQNDVRQTVRWESGVAIPDVVTALACRLEQARGWLGLCAD